MGGEKRIFGMSDDDEYNNSLSYVTRPRENTLLGIFIYGIGNLINKLVEIFSMAMGELMKPDIKGAFIGAAATLVVGIPAAFYAYKGYALQQQVLTEEIKKKDEIIATYKQRYEVAPRQFIDELEKLIVKAAEENEKKQGQSKIIPAAKALVAARNDLRGSLDSLRDKLDSEIDMLEKESAKKKPDEKKVSELVDVINRKWSIKKPQIELEIGKLQRELGLVPQ